VGLGRYAYVRSSLCLLITVIASSETIQHKTLPSHIIEKRLAAFSGTSLPARRFFATCSPKRAASRTTLSINWSKKQTYRI
jgi:hypothetical protein